MNYIAHIGENSGTIKQYYLNDLKVTPAEVEFKAVKSYGFVSFVVTFFAILLIFPIGKFIHIFIKNTNIDLFLATMTITLILLFFLSFINYILQKIPIGNVKYKDQKVTIDGTTYSFYKDIWDIEYSKNYRIKFDQDAKAKYIYNLFRTIIRE